MVQCAHYEFYHSHWHALSEGMSVSCLCGRLKKIARTAKVPKVGDDMVLHNLFGMRVRKNLKVSY
jgi:hypothetical protein